MGGGGAPTEKNFDIWIWRNTSTWRAPAFICWRSRCVWQGRALEAGSFIKASLHPPPLRGPRHHNNGLNSGLPSILWFCTAAVALAAESFSIMTEQEEVEGKEGWRWELTTLNYTVVSSPLADNWTCNHRRRLFSSPRSHAPGRRGADLNGPLTPVLPVRE